MRLPQVEGDSAAGGVGLVAEGWAVLAAARAAKAVARGVRLAGEADLVEVVDPAVADLVGPAVADLVGPAVGVDWGAGADLAVGAAVALAAGLAMAPE
jgi:hypothetical protein